MLFFVLYHCKYYRLCLFWSAGPAKLEDHFEILGNNQSSSCKNILQNIFLIQMIFAITGNMVSFTLFHFSLNKLHLILSHKSEALGKPNAC